MRKAFYWNELTTFDFSEIKPDETVAVLPIASTEQHGPHLPIATDTAIARGMLDELQNQLPDDLDILVLPVQEIGKANEHKYGKGTLSLSAPLLIEAWTAIGEKVAEAGVRKLVIVNSHGGNSDIASIVGRELRVRFDMLVVTTGWGNFGSPEGLFGERERNWGIHGGDGETSLMLYFRPELVHMDKAEDFYSVSEKLADEGYEHIKPAGKNSIAWIARDLNPAGTVGEAAKATAEKGEASCKHKIKGFIELLREVKRYPLSNLHIE